MLEEGNKVPTGLKGILVTQEDAKTSTGSATEKIGKKISLSSLYKNENLILYFYPRDMTPGCIIEAESFRDSYKKFKKAGYQVVGVSRDDAKKHYKFIDKKGLTFPLLTDDSGKITEAFGVWQLKKFMGKEFMGIVRSTFIIRKGKIIKVYPKVKVKEHVDQILADLKTL